MTANAVANSYVAYVNAGAARSGACAAHVLEQATSAAGSGPLGALIVTGLIGALAGAIDRGHRVPRRQPQGQAAAGTR